MSPTLFNEHVSYDDDEDEDEDKNSTISATARSQVSAAPSALRRGKYASNIISCSNNESPSRSDFVTARTDMSDRCTLTAYDRFITEQVAAFNRKERSRMHKISSSRHYDNDGMSVKSSKSHRTELDGDSETVKSNRSSRLSSGRSRSHSGSPTGVADFFCDAHVEKDRMEEPCGSILARCSSSSLIFKQWKERYWTKYGPSTIYIFRSESDFNTWKEWQGKNIDHSNKLIKLKVDFDTAGALKRAKREAKRAGEAYSCHAGGMQDGSLRVFKYGVLDVKSKKYFGHKKKLYVPDA